MHYAIIKSGGKQHRVAVGDIIDVELLKAEMGKPVRFEEVLFVHDGHNPHFGGPTLQGYFVEAQLVDFVSGPKIQSVKYKRRKRCYKKWGHRQHYSRVKITAIQKPHKAKEK